MLPSTQASQNLVVLAREDAGAEKIFRSNGVQLLQRLLDTGETDLMLAALRTLVGICSEHQSRVGGPVPGRSVAPSVSPFTLYQPQNGTYPLRLLPGTEAGSMGTWRAYFGGVRPLTMP